MNDETERKLPALTSGSPVRAIVPQDFDSAWRIANAVVVAGMAPRELGNAERCTIAILHGLEVGLPPMAALQSIAVINGRPTIWGDGAMALVQSSGKLETIKETVEGEGDKRVAICRAIRKGDPEPKIGRFSVQDATLAGLWGKAGPWKQYPNRMLQMRARAFCLRDAFADVLRGLGIAEEVRDINVDPAPEVNVPLTPPKPPSRPTPPKPPAKPSNVAEKINTPPADVNFDAPAPHPGDLLSSLDAAFDEAQNAEEIEEVWNEFDLMAQLENLPQGEQFQGVALSIKRRHLSRLANSV
jgi:hypothetical protein